MSGAVLLVAGHGAIGGGEVMLLACGHAVREAGFEPVLVAPPEPSDLADAARAQDLPVVVHGGGVTAVARLRSIRRAVQDTRSRQPSALAWCHGLIPSVATAGMPRRVVHLHRVPDARQRAAVYLACAGATDVVVPSEDTRTRLPAGLVARARVLANWTGEPAVPPGRRGGDVSVRRVGFLGRPAAGKGLEELCRAMAALNSRPAGPAVHLDIAGRPHFVAGDQQRVVDHAVASLGDHATMLGWRDRDDFLAGIDVLAVPSRWPESFGLVAAEAMAAHVPVVVSDAGALPEVVGPDHPYTAHRGDATDLTRVLAQALGDLGTQRGRDVVELARCRWEAHWSPQAGHQRVREALARWRGVS